MTNPIVDRIATLGRQLFDLKQRKKDLEEELSDVEKQIKELAEGDLAKLMAESEVEKLSIKDVGTVYLSDALYASLLKENRDKFHKWLRDNGHGALIQEYVFPQTLTAFVKEQRSNNETLPDEVKVTIIPTAKTRAAS